MSFLGHEVGNFHRDEATVYSLLSDVIKEPVKRGVALGSIIKNEEVLEKLSEYKYPVYGFLHNDVPVIFLMPMDSSEYFVNPPIVQATEDMHNVSDELFETLISNNCMVISISLRGEWNVHYKEVFVTINKLVCSDGNDCNYCIDYMISRYAECAYLTGTFFNKFQMNDCLCNGLKSKLNQRLDFNDLEAYLKAIAFLNIVTEVKKLTSFVSTNSVYLPFDIDSIFYQPNLKFKYFGRYDFPMPCSVSSSNDLYTAKELSTLVYSVYFDFYRKPLKEGVDRKVQIANDFCEKVPSYASRRRGDFRRPYELVEGVYADGNLSVDRALLKARKAIMDLGLNPFDFKYKFEKSNMLINNGMFK